MKIQCNVASADACAGIPLLNEDEEMLKITFYDLYEKHSAILQDRIFTILRDRDQARDIVQDIFLQLWISRNKLVYIRQPEAWLQVVAKNRVINLQRRNKRYALYQETKINESIGYVVDDCFAKKETLSLIQKAVMRLTPRQREIYYLQREHKFSRQEIARLLNVSENTIKNQLQTATQAVRAYLFKELEN